MLDTEKEACLILDEATAILSLAYNLAGKEKVKQTIPVVQNELLALKNEINTRDHSFDPARVSALVADIGADSKPAPKLAINQGSAALDLAAARVRHAAGKVGLINPWGMNQLAFDNLNKLADVLYELARGEE